MTVTALPVRDEYTATGGQTVFNYTFLIFTNLDLNVYITPVGQDADDATDITTAYTVDSGTIGNPAGGFITLNSGVSAGDLITIVSDIVDDRTTDYQNSGDFLPDVVNNDFDRVVSLVKQQEDRSARALTFPESQQNSAELTLPQPVAGQYLIWNPAATGLINTVTDPSNDAALINYSPPFTGSQSRSVESRLSDIVSVNDFGAVGDGNVDGTGTDDTAAIQAALDTGLGVDLGNGNYRVTSPLLVTTAAQRIYCQDGRWKATIIVDHTSGAGIAVSAGRVDLSDFIIMASDSRSTTGADFSLSAGNYGVQVYDAGGVMSEGTFSRILSMRHPNHGFYMGGAGAGTKFDQCESQYNRGHGFLFDDRTDLAGPSSRCGIITFDSCRAVDNGGNGLQLSRVGSTCFRFNIIELETINNAWNTDMSGLDNAEYYIGGENHIISISAAADTNGDTRSVMGNGDPRIVKASLSMGMLIRASSNNIQVINQRFISTRKGIKTGSGVLYLKVSGGYFTQQQLSGGPINQTVGFDIGTNYGYLNIEIPSTALVDTIVDSDSAGGRIRIDNDEYYIYGEQGTSLLGVIINLSSFEEYTVAATVLNVQATNIELNASGVTDLIAIYTASSSNLLADGLIYRMVNISTHIITVKDGSGTGQIRTKSGGDVVINPDTAFHVMVRNGTPYEI